MQRLKKHFSLIEVEPILVKEWHPSANGNLTPRNVTVVYPKKVWWICGDGHEWRATIKCRIKGNGCPLCQKVEDENTLSDDKDNSWQKAASANQPSSRNTNTIFESDYPDANIDKDFRKSRRFIIKTTAILEIPSSGHWFYVQIRNFSHSGMYVETEAAFRPGTKVKINLDQPLFYSDQKSYNSIIRWCKELDDENQSFSNYGLGVKFI